MGVDYIGNTIDTHTAGEPTRILLDAWEMPSKSATVGEIRNRFASELDWIRKALISEPRGHKGMFGAVPTVSSHDEAALGLFLMDSEGYLDMCGHGTIGVVTALIETGRLPPDNSLFVETPAGIVRTDPVVSETEVEKVQIQNVSSFVYDQVTVTTGDYGPFEVSLVYAGNFFALVNARKLGIAIREENINDLVEAGRSVRQAINNSVDIIDPLTGKGAEVSITELYESSDDIDKNIAVFANGAYDRSPCGTGTCAKMTHLHEAGQLGIGETYVHESIIGTRFEGRIRDVETVDGLTVTTPEISGSAYVTGMNTFVIAPDDPVPGFTTTSET